MSNLQFKRIRICSEIEQAGMELEFHPKKNLLWGRNGAGKSAVLKSLFRAFDAEPLGDIPGWDYGAIVAVDFTIDGRELTTVRREDLRAIFEGDKLLGASTSSMRFNDIFCSIVGFKLRLMDRVGRFRAAAPSNYFLPFFVNQDGSFGTGWDTFSGIKQFQKPVEHTLEYFAKVRPQRYFELKAEESQKKIRKDNLKVELATLSRTRSRLRRSLRVSPVRITAKEFNAEMSELITVSVELAKKQEVIRKNLVEDQWLVKALADQVRLSDSALKEHAADFKFAAEVSTDDLGFTCPTCNAVHSDSYHTFLELAEDARELAELKRSLEKRIEVVKPRIERNRRMALDLKKEYSKIQDVLNVRRGKFTFDEFIQSYSAHAADSQLASESREVTREMAVIDSDLGLVKSALKELAETHDSKAPLEEFRNYFSATIVDLSVESLPGLDKWGLAKRPSNSGSRSARSIIAYYSALWKTIAENGFLPAPVVIDSPNQGAQDKEHLKKLLVNVALKAPVNTQVILAHEEHPEDFAADKVINFVKGNKVLTADGFVKVYTPLFEYVQSARLSLLTSEGGEPEDIEDAFDL